MRYPLFKHTFLSSICLVFAFPGFSQVIDKWKGKNVEKVLQGTLVVRVAQSDSFNSRVADAFNKYWKTSPFEMYHPSKSYKTDKNFSYALFSASVVSLAIDRGTRTNETSQNYPFFVYGESSETGKPHGGALIGVFPINSFHYEFDVNADNQFEGAYLRMPYIIYNLNDMVGYLKNSGTEKDYYDYIGKKTARLSTKTLIIPEDVVKEWDVHPNTTAMMKNNFEKKKKMKSIMHQILDQSDITYAGKYKVMSTDQITALEKGPDASKYALFLPAIDDRKYVLVFDLATKELLYFDHTKMSLKIKDKDFDKLNEAAGL